VHSGADIFTNGRPIYLNELSHILQLSFEIFRINKLI